MIRFLGLFATALLLVLGADVWAADSALETSRRFDKSVVSLIIARQGPDLEAPWKRVEKQTGKFLGVVVKDRRILTSAWAVGHAVFIEMRRFGDSAKHEMRVAFADYESNLALLAPVDNSVMDGLEPIRLADPTQPGTEVDLLREQDVYQMRRVSSRLSQVDVMAPQTGSLAILTYKLESKEEGLGWCEPVVRDGRLVGLTQGQDERNVYVVPSPIIRHFLEDKAGPDYRGFPGLSIQVRELNDPALRRLLNAQSTKNGVRVARVFESSPFLNLVQVDDVLVKIGDVDIGNTGFYEDKVFGKIPLSFLTNQRYGGEAVTLGLLRRGKPLTVKAVLPRFDSNRTVVRRHSFLAPEPYMIFGGLVFLELSRPYVESWGDSWRYRAPLNLVYRVDFEDVPRQDPAERIVVLSRVLADDFNRGYEDVQPQVLLTANGQRIGSIRQLERVLSQNPEVRRNKRWARLTFDLGSGEIILPVDGLAKVHSRIADTYGIPANSAFFDSLDDVPGPIGKGKRP